ncbi:hypothetical protein SH661x_003061 [Planctomicrobium sp. SH661]|uniref:hypothetical protein n=1 Tax=Planctomicrobium sp. SH661 TaxID=3448124 RepID=UPI003F5CA660
MQKTGSLPTIALCIAMISSAARAEEPLNIGDRRELLIDTHLIAAKKGITFRQHDPKAGDVVLTCDAPWEGNTSAYFTLIEDEDRFRVYYRGSGVNETTKQGIHTEFTCYAESQDGIHWTKPNLGLFEFQGSKDNNIVWSADIDGFASHCFAPFKDDNPDCHPDAKFKAFAGEFKKGLRAFQSPDGIHWKQLHPENVITDGFFDSQNTGFWDPVRGCYASYFRHFRNGELRDIKTATSADFIHWSNAEFLRYDDQRKEHLYTNAIRPYVRAPHIYIGFPTRYQEKTQQVEPILMTSRDGLNFHRWSEPLIPISAPMDRDGNRSNYMANGLLQLPGQDRELSVYATEAYYTGLGSRLRRFVFRTDGFVSASADQMGEIVTKPLRFSGTTLSLNYCVKPGGSVRVELLDAESNPLQGFSLEESKSMTGDEIDAVVSWNDGSDLSKLKDQPIRVRLHMDRADVFAIQFQN